jgi:hypothetical protein
MKMTAEQADKRKYLKDIALLAAVNCVRNTVIETYHAQGKIDNAEMEAFNREVTDKLYTFLCHLLGAYGDEAAEEFFQGAWLTYPKEWAKPKMNQAWSKAMGELRSLVEDTRPV